MQPQIGRNSMVTNSLPEAPLLGRRPGRSPSWNPRGPNASVGDTNASRSATGQVSDCEIASNGVPNGAKGPHERTPEIGGDLPLDLRSAVRLRLFDPPIREHGLTEAELLDAYSHLAPEADRA